MPARRVVPTETVPMVKVYALNDKVKRSVVHEPTKYKFKADGTSMWPLDTFTKRRINDGSISLKAPKQSETPAEPQSAEAPAEPQSAEAQPAEASSQQQVTSTRRRSTTSEPKPTESQS